MRKHGSKDELTLEKLSYEQIASVEKKFLESNEYIWEWMITHNLFSWSFFINILMRYFLLPLSEEF